MLELSDITIEGRTRLTHGEYAGLSDISLKMLEMILGGKLKLKKKSLEIKPVTQIANPILELNSSIEQTFTTQQEKR